MVPGVVDQVGRQPVGRHDGQPDRSGLVEDLGGDRRPGTRQIGQVGPRRRLQGGELGGTPRQSVVVGDRAQTCERKVFEPTCALTVRRSFEGEQAVGVQEAVHRSQRRRDGEPEQTDRSPKRGLALGLGCGEQLDAYPLALVDQRGVGEGRSLARGNGHALG